MWCEDKYGSDSRVLRGGSFYIAASLARSTNRDTSPPAFAAKVLGVRPARALTPR
jgi:formylglycine-generating enzyme required for sulfatase activity